MVVVMVMVVVVVLVVVLMKVVVERVVVVMVVVMVLVVMVALAMEGFSVGFTLESTDLNQLNLTLGSEGLDICSFQCFLRWSLSLV